MRARVTAAAILLATASAAHATPFQELEQARRAFRASDYASAVPLLKDLLYPAPRLARADEIVESRVLLGSCQFELGDHDSARKQFEEALAMQPDLQLDTLLYSQGAVKLFNDTRAEAQGRANADRALREAEAAREEYQRKLSSLVYYEVHPLAANFIPFGVGQFQNKQYKKGIVLAAGEAVLLGTSAGIWAYLVAQYGYSGRVPPADAAGVNHLQIAEVVSGGGFILMAAIGIGDALYHYRYRVRVTPDDALLPPDLRAKPAAKKTSLRDRIHFGPVVLPSGLGVGFALED